MRILESGMVGFAYVLTVGFAYVFTIGFSFFNRHSVDLETYAVFQKTGYTISTNYTKKCVFVTSIFVERQL